jgi:predicted TIM-barrel fold metal-dependent hydrolase
MGIPSPSSLVPSTAQAGSRLIMPRGACDCHTHVFGSQAQYPMSSDRVYTPGLADSIQLAALHRRLGCSRWVVVQPSPYGTDNRCTLDAVRAANAEDADAACAVVVPDDDDGMDELRAMHAAGARGVRVNLETTGMHDAAHAQTTLENVARRVAPLGWHVQIYTNLRMVEQLAETIARLPVPVVLDHFAGMRGESGLDQPGLATLIDLLATGNIYVKLSAAQRASKAPDCVDLCPLVRLFVERRNDRLLWGSDWPHPAAWPNVARNPAVVEPFHPINDERALARLAEWVLEKDQFDCILSANPARLYGWS